MTLTPDARIHNSAHVRDRVVHANQLRRWAVTDALGYIVNGMPDAALERLIESVMGEQAKAAGLRAWV